MNNGGIFGRMLRRRTVIIGALLVVLLPTLTGCYGRFPLTNRVYDFNGEVHENKFVKSLVMWAFVIIPVYGVSMFVDAIVFNLVEFWTGDQLLSTTTTDAEGNSVALTASPDGREAIVTLSRDGKVIAEERFVKVSDTRIEVRNADGALHGLVLKSEDGSLRLCDRNGGVIRTLAAEHFMSL